MGCLTFELNEDFIIKLQSTVPAPIDGALKKEPLSFNPIRTEGVSRKHNAYIIDSHVKMSEVNGFFFLDFAN